MFLEFCASFCAELCKKQADAAKIIFIEGVALERLIDNRCTGEQLT